MSPKHHYESVMTRSEIFVQGGDARNPETFLRVPVTEENMGLLAEYASVGTVPPAPKHICSDTCWGSGKVPLPGPVVVTPRKPHVCGPECWFPRREVAVKLGSGDHTCTEVCWDTEATIMPEPRPGESE